MQSTRDGAFCLLRLDPGEPVHEALAEWARAEGIEAAAIVSGIGMVRDTEIGYLRGTKYDTTVIPEPLELLALTGSIAVDEGRPSLHLHLIGGRPDHSTVGGHLVAAKVALIAEVTVRVFPGQTFRRLPLPGSGLKALQVAGTPKARAPRAARVAPRARRARR